MSKWIDIKTEKPPAGDALNVVVVLAFCTSLEQPVCFANVFNFSGEVAVIPQGTHGHEDRVTHWQPLPGAPTVPTADENLMDVHGDLIATLGEDVIACNSLRDARAHLPHLDAPHRVMACGEFVVVARLRDANKLERAGWTRQRS